MKPWVSVVMPSFNQARFIERALNSVLTQSWQNVELIVQDGGSTDGTLELLERVSKHDHRLRWESAPDRGPADAINRALQRVKGTYIGWLNSDDEYTPSAIERAMTAMQKHPDWMLCYGQGDHVDEHGNFIGHYPTLPAANDPHPEVPDSREFRHGCFICQPTVFFKAVMPGLIGTLDTALGASFDFDYWLRAFSGFPGRIGYVPHVQAYSRLHNETITHRQRLRVALEGMQVLARHQGNAPGHWLLTYLDERRRSGATEQNIQSELKSLLPQIESLMQAGEWEALKRRTSRHETQND